MQFWCVMREMPGYAPLFKGTVAYALHTNQQLPAGLLCAHWIADTGGSILIRAICSLVRARQVMIGAPYALCASCMN